MGCLNVLVYNVQWQNNLIFNYIATKKATKKVHFPCLGFSSAKKFLQKNGCFCPYKLRKMLIMRNFAV